MQAILFLVNALTSFFCTLFLLRFIMQLARVSFAGQIGDFVIKLTNWAVITSYSIHYTKLYESALRQGYRLRRRPVRRHGADASRM